MKTNTRFMTALFSASVAFTVPTFSAQAQTVDTVRTVLATAPLGANKAVIQKLYADRAFAPIFFNNGAATAAAQDLKNAVIGVAPLHGLRSSDYWLSKFDGYFTTALDPNAASIAEAEFAKVYVDLAVHISVGRVIPSSISSDIKYSKQPFNAAALSQGLAGEGIGNMLNRIAPQHDLYRKQMQILARLLQIKAQGGFPSIAAPAKTLKLGVSSPVVTQMKARLIQLGYQISNTSPVFDQELQNAVKDVQMNNLTDPTGQLASGSSSSWEYFGHSSDARIKQVEINLEKLRWLPHQLETKHVFVNLATQHLYLTDPNLDPRFYMLRDMKIINGRKERKTPSMRDETKNIVMNPTWGVPTTVFREDKVPMIRDVLNTQGQWGLQSWFAEKRFTVMDSSFTNYINPLSIDWVNLDPKAANFYIVQQPGYDNALGVAKVMLGNPWSIYMHDTNERNLFVNNLRALSSGCMRMSQPLDMVEYLLQGTEWDRTKIEGFVPHFQGETRDKETWVKIPPQNKVALYTLPITANLGDDGVVRFTRDLYSQNASVLRALTDAGFYRPQQ